MLAEFGAGGVRAKSGRADPLVFCMFDLLVAGGHSLMSRPLFARKARLKDLFTPKPKHDCFYRP